MSTLDILRLRLYSATLRLTGSRGGPAAAIRRRAESALSNLMARYREGPVHARCRRVLARARLARSRRRLQQLDDAAAELRRQQAHLGRQAGEAADRSARAVARFDVAGQRSTVAEEARAGGEVHHIDAELEAVEESLVPLRREVASRQAEFDAADRAWRLCRARSTVRQATGHDTVGRRSVAIVVTLLACVALAVTLVAWHRTGDTDGFRLVGAMAEPREDFTATVLPGGGVVVIGGVSSQDVPLRTVELFDPDSETFKSAGTLATPRFNHAAVRLPDGRVLVCGGEAAWRGRDAFDTAELYDPSTGRSTTTGRMHQARTRHQATLLDDGRVLVSGGMDADGRALDSAEVFDPRTGQFTALSSMTRPRLYHTATRLDDGRVLLCGGMSGTVKTPTARTDAELFDPGTGRFEATGSMAVPRVEGAATLLDDGRVFVSGGTPGLGGRGTRVCEVYDPEEGTFARVADATHGRRVHGAVKLPDGRVLLVGGESTRDHPKAELYDPEADRFTAIDSPLQRRFNAVTVVLPDGRGLVVGGYHLVSHRRMTQAEIYRTGD